MNRLSVTIDGRYFANGMEVSEAVYYKADAQNLRLFEQRYERFESQKRYKQGKGGPTIIVDEVGFRRKTHFKGFAHEQLRSRAVDRSAR